jgi:hypothetical protein
MLANISRWGLASALLCLACDTRVCTDHAGGTSALPQRLSQTGLFDDLGRDRIAPRVLAYEPEFALWSDGADKRRWLLVPEGELIDSANPDDWRFPKGTKLWKEFSHDGLHLETRLLQKTGDGEADWVAAAYVWRQDQRDAELAPYGALDVLGTAHDVPASGECFGCHDGRPGKVLGFSAIQLAPRAVGEMPRLSDEAQRARLSEPLPVLEVPGSSQVRAALGYLHANCSHCHNQSASAKSAEKCFNPNRELGFELDFSLYAGQLGDVERTATYRTAIGEVVERGRPDASKVVRLMSSRAGGFAQMPPLGTELVDEPGVHAVSEWIGSL